MTSACMVGSGRSKIARDRWSMAMVRAVVPPVLTDDGGPDEITLRPLTSADCVSVCELACDPQVQQWTAVPSPYSMADAAAYLRAQRRAWARDVAWTFAIQARTDYGQSRFAGSLTLRRAGGGAAEVGFALMEWARGRGVMSRALRLALDWGFTDRGLTVVRWQAQVGNWDSRRVAWACGFRLEGIVRGLCHQRGVSHDGWIGSLARGEPLSPAHHWLVADELEGGQVRLRPWLETDVPAVVEAGRDPTTQRFLPDLPTGYASADAQWFIRSRAEELASGRGISWCLADLQTDLCLGQISLSGLDRRPPVAEVGYWLHPAGRGRGLMTQALHHLSAHAFTAWGQGGLGLDRLALHVAASNQASADVARRVGFVPYGRATAAARRRAGPAEDLLLFERVRG